MSRLKWVLVGALLALLVTDWARLRLSRSMWREASAQSVKIAEGCITRNNLCLASLYACKAEEHVIAKSDIIRMNNIMEAKKDAPPKQRVGVLEARGFQAPRGGTGKGGPGRSELPDLDVDHQ